MQIQAKLVAHKHHVQGARFKQALRATVASALETWVKPRTRPSLVSQDVVTFQHKRFETCKPKESLQVVIVSVPARLVQVAGDHAFELVQDDALEGRQLLNDSEVAKHGHFAESSLRLAYLESAFVVAAGDALHEWCKLGLAVSHRLEGKHGHERRTRNHPRPELVVECCEEAPATRADVLW